MNPQTTPARSASPSPPQHWMRLGSKLVLVTALWFAAGLLQAAEVIEIPPNQALFLVLPAIFLVYGVVKLILMWRDIWGHP